MKAKQTHLDLSQFGLHIPEYKTLVDFYLWGEIARDSGLGDITTNILLQGKSKQVVAHIKIQANGVLAGREEVEYFLEETEIQQEWFVQDGEELMKDKKLLTLTGEASEILKVERAILNFLGRLSGIATFTKACVNQVPETILVCPTRKTLWGLLDKKACVLGGGGTHRLRAQDAFLCKENHLILSEPWENFENILKNTPKDFFHKFCEIEVETEEEAWNAAKLLSEIDVPGVIMFDNFEPKYISSLAKEIRDQYPNIILEASGGISEKNIQEYGETGIDILSLGALTHTAPHFPLSLRLEKVLEQSS